MIDTQTLLPPNATSAERALEMSMRVREPLHDAADIIDNLKTTPPEAFLLWLVWEYGLEELLPYLPDPAAVIAQGVNWQRIKGTPESLRLALSWLNYGAPATEEEQPTGAHWSEFMVDPGGVPPRDKIAGVKNLAELSAPVGTLLTRIFHGYDVRRFLLDGSQFGDLLSDHSGIRDQELGVVLSFGRNTDSAAKLDGETAATSAQARLHGTFNKYDDRPLWDFSRFGDAPVRNHRIMHAHLFQVRSDGLQADQFGAEETVFPKAAVVLSDGFVLGDTNSALFAIEYREIGAPAPLSDGFALSGEPWRIDRLPIDERFERETESDGAYLFESSSATGGEFFRISTAINPAPTEQAAALMDVATTSAATIRGQYWTGVPWLSQTWAELQFNVRTKHYGDPA